MCTLLHHWYRRYASKGVKNQSRNPRLRGITLQFGRLSVSVNHVRLDVNLAPQPSLTSSLCKGRWIFSQMYPPCTPQAIQQRHHPARCGGKREDRTLVVTTLGTAQNNGKWREVSTREKLPHVAAVDLFGDTAPTKINGIE